ncbi:MAG: plasmid partitioning protein RepB [Bacteroidales bacterium]|nr:plasmid partitioning protein RepB [Bacteroidales bacterium]
MSKRTQSIRSMFTGKSDEALPADNTPSVPRVTSGAVKSLKDTFSGVERDYQELRDKLSSGAVAIDLDSALVDPSPFSDRFAEQDPQSFDALKQSLAERGQEIPILVREHPLSHGRYQCAYGHRRVRALRDLGRSVKAYVRALSDEDLVVAQGIENSTREDLSFIERAIFAVKLETAGFQRSVIQAALSIDRAEASKLVAVGRAVPADIVEAIGRAPKIGRGRWQSLADLIRDEGALQRTRDALASEAVRSRTTDERFGVALAAASGRAEAGDAPSEEVVARNGNGQEIAKLTRSAKQCRIQIDREREGGFADFVMQKLPELYAAYTSERRSQE